MGDKGRNKNRIKKVGFAFYENMRVKEREVSVSTIGHRSTDGIDGFDLIGSSSVGVAVTTTAATAVTVTAAAAAGSAVNVVATERGIMAGTGEGAKTDGASAASVTCVWTSVSIAAVSLFPSVVTGSTASFPASTTSFISTVQSQHVFRKSHRMSH